MGNIPLTKLQKEIMREFYSIQPTKVLFNKKQRMQLWNEATSRSQNFDFNSLSMICPALTHQIKRSYDSGNNIQPAVFSECVYAQTIANMFGLTEFHNYYLDKGCIPDTVKDLLCSYQLVPRYVYSAPDKTRILIQAGGCDGIDSALITIIDFVIYTIEFKEPNAKTSEIDLPKYNENGLLDNIEEWMNKHAQFGPMLNEQKSLNFFEKMGHNINSFSNQSVMFAVSNNYTNKLLNVICTEDKHGYLTIIPANQVQQWANIQGEIRTAGRNHYDVWTPIALHKILINFGASIENGIITIDKKHLEFRKERGGKGKISGYKITPFFFIYSKKCSDDGERITFYKKDIQQLNPTIAGKVFFNDLLYLNVKRFYFEQL